MDPGDGGLLGVACSDGGGLQGVSRDSAPGEPAANVAAHIPPPGAVAAKAPPELPPMGALPPDTVSLEDLYRPGQTHVQRY